MICMYLNHENPEQECEVKYTESPTPSFPGRITQGKTYLPNSRQNVISRYQNLYRIMQNLWKLKKPAFKFMATSKE